MRHSFNEDLNFDWTEFKSCTILLLGLALAYWAVLSLSFRRISIMFMIIIAWPGPQVTILHIEFGNDLALELSDAMVFAISMHGTHLNR